jgi:hypothetical protein
MKKIITVSVAIIAARIKAVAFLKIFLANEVTSIQR